MSLGYPAVLPTQNRGIGHGSSCPFSGNPKIFLNKRRSPRLGHRHGLKLQGNSAHFCLDGPRQTAGYPMFHVEHEAQCNLGHNSAPLKGNVGDVLLLKAGAATRR